MSGREKLSAFSRKTAAFLAENNARTAAICAKSSDLAFAAVIACVACGVCYIPINNSLPAERREKLLREADIVLDESILCGIAEKYPERDFVLPKLCGNHPVYQIYTSGTTGEPKGIEVSRGNLGSFLRWFLDIPAISRVQPKRVLSHAAFSFDLSVAALYYCMYSGAEFIKADGDLMRDFDGAFRRMRESRAELFVLTPTYAELCMCDRSFNQVLLPQLRVFFFCGEVLKPQTAARLFERFPDVHIINAYGPSEACCAVTAAEIFPDKTQSPLPIGDLSHTAGEIRIIDGEIVIFGESVARYTGEQSGGFRTVGGERCFFTGDSGFIRDNMLYFSGRRDRQLKIKGYRIEPEDIENNLLRIDGVKQALVSLNGRRLKAEVVTDGTLSAEQIRSRLTGLLPDYMIPAEIAITERLFANENGKLIRGR